MMCMEETSDTLTLAAEERAKQGIHELEISFNGELDLHKHFDKCEKNPGHYKFIPVNKLQEHHLPKHRNSRQIADWVRHIADFTVKLSVNYVSPNRPPGYPLSDRAGQNVLSVGSGYVKEFSLTENNDKPRCPLKHCDHRPEYHKLPGYITIVTAAHVVFDDEEAKNTTVEFFYDDSTDRSGVMIASGVKVTASSVEGDFCELVCVTHEINLIVRLKYKLIPRRIYAKAKEICQLFRTSLPGIESIVQYYEPDWDLMCLAEIRLSNPGEAIKTLFALWVARENVLNRVLANWNPSNNSLWDVLRNTKLSNYDLLGLMDFALFIVRQLHVDEQFHNHLSKWQHLYLCISRSSINKNLQNYQESIFSLLSEIGKHCSTLEDMGKRFCSLKTWNYLNSLKVLNISKYSATIEVTLFEEKKYNFIEGDDAVYMRGGELPDDSESNPDDMFLVHIAHPHGQSKHVTIGRQTRCFTGDGFYHQLYTAPTCPGCSGGPVWMIPASGNISEVYGVPHSGHHGNQLNKGVSWTVYPFYDKL